MSTSQIFTIGTALRRAEDNRVPVEVLVEGQWIKGNIAALDGDGLVLVTPERTQCVVRNAHISVVRLLSDVSFDDGASDEPAPASHDGNREAAEEAPSSYSWATTFGSRPTSAAAPPATAPPAARADGADLADDDRLVLDAGANETLELGSAHGSDALVLEGSVDEGPRELGIGRSDVEEWTLSTSEHLDPHHVEPELEAVLEPAVEPILQLVKEPEAEAEVQVEAETVLEAEAEVVPQVEAESDPVAEPTTPDVAEAPADMVSRLLAESMREAGIEPGADSMDDAAPAEPVELLHADRTPDSDEEPRVFALPAACALTEPAPPPAPQPAAQPAAQPTVQPTVQPVAAPAAAVAETPAAPAAVAETPAAPAPVGDDWRSMLEGLRGEASTPAPAEQAPDKKRARRLAMR